MSSEDPNMIQAAAPSGYSAAVRIELLMNGHTFPVAQMGRGLLIFDEPVSLPAQSGELVLTVDGHPRRWSISIPPTTGHAKVLQAQFQTARDSTR